MSEIDYEKLAGLVADKLDRRGDPGRDKTLIKELVSEMVKHRSPCHNFDNDEVDSIKAFISKEKKLAKGRFLITWGIILYILKSLYDIAIINIHWGE
jgi:hypothetical protein